MRTERGRRRVDWGEAVGLVFDWTFAIGQYVFCVLLLGLVGGILPGNLADVAFAFLKEDWVGHGRQAGWILGALLAAVGLPLGWVRPDNKKFSFPSPRKVRRKVTKAGRQQRTRRKSGGWKKDEQIRNLTDAVKLGGLLSLIGTILGLMLGLYLATCWMSLALSPLAAGGWFEGLEITSTLAGGQLSTSHPIAIGLGFFPMMVLGLVGLVGGTILGLALNVIYRVSVPRDDRAEHQEERRASLRAKRVRWFAPLIGIALIGLGTAGSLWTLRQLALAADSRHWPSVEGRIVQSEVESHRDSDGDTKYKAAIRYRYQLDGMAHFGDRISFGGFTSGDAAQVHRLVRHYRKGTTVRVFYDLDQRDRSVLEPGLSSGLFLMLGFSCMLLVPGLFTMLMCVERWLAKVF